MTPKSIRIFFGADDDPENHRKFKTLCVANGTSMSARMMQFIERDIERWEVTGTPINLNGDSEDCKIDDDCQRFLRALIQGQKPPNALTVRLAHKMDLDPHLLCELVKLAVKDAEKVVK